MTVAFRRFLAHLQEDLRRPLPGRTAQYDMAPRPRPDAEEDDGPRVDARQSGVLILFYPHVGDTYLPLILRQTYGGVHSGQVGLPGGGYEASDGDLVDTALRETQEEIGVPSGEIVILGQLSPLYVSPSNYMVQPTVGWIARRPRFLIDPYEVALLIEAPLAELLDPDNKYVEVWQLRDRAADVPYFGIQDQIIWGATAMILGELLALPAIQYAPGVSKKE